MYEEITFEMRGPVAILTINRPHRMNSIDPVTSAEMVDAFGRFRDDADALVLVLTGAGNDAFCAGADLKSVGAAFNGEEGAQFLITPDPDELAAHARGERDGIIGPSRWTGITKPVIAAVNGVAYAGGLEWACFADIRIASENASFGVTCRRWNIGLGDGGTQRLPRIIGMGRAMEMIITGRVIDAVEAERIGLVNRIVGAGEALDCAVELAEEIAALPQPAIRTDKEAAVRGFGRPLDEGLRIEAECFNRLFEGPEMAEGLRRFIERDHPDRRPGAGPVTPGLVRAKNDG